MLCNTFIAAAVSSGCAFILASVTEKHALSGLDQVTDLAIEISHFFAFRKTFVCFLGVFCSTIWVIIHMYCEALSNQLCSICLNLSRELSPLHLGIHPAASISSQLINKHQ